MNAKEITLENLKAQGFKVGKSIKGKGTEVFVSGDCVTSLYSYDSVRPFDKEDVDKAIKQIKEIGIENCYIYKCTTRDNESFNFTDNDNFRASLKNLNLKEIMQTRFSGFKYLNIATLPKHLGYISLTKYNSSLESQQQLLIDLEFLYGVQIYDGMFSDDEYSIGERYFDISDDIDYEAIWGDDCYAQDKDDCIYFEGRGSYQNSVLDDFWNFTINEESDNYFKEIDPDESITLYHRKGKDWYIGYRLELEDVYITYKNEDDEIVEEEVFYVLKYRENEELLNKFVDWCESSKRDLEIKSYIYNELELKDCYGASDFSYNDNIFNLKILNKEFDYDLYECAYTIIDYIDYKDKNDVKILALNAYEKYLQENLKDGKLFEKYTHLKILENEANKDGKKLVYTRIGDFTEDKSYAITFKGEEYHFSLSELYSQSPKKFYRNICESISKRLIERYEQTILIQKAQKVFVGLEDSYSAGNCKTGTSAWCSRFGINTDKIGALRGDEILKLDYSNFTKRAVLQAIQTHTQKGL